MKQPIHPLYKTESGTIRFKGNAIVQHLLGTHQSSDMNRLACLDFSDEYRRQFAQLIGYSLNGYGELSYVSDDAYGAAAIMADEESNEKDARITYLEHELFMVRSSLRDPIARLYGLHPDDLNQ